MYATWVVRRSQVTRGPNQSAIPGFVTVGTWIGTRQSMQTSLQQFPGMPVVTADVVAYIDADAGAFIAEGDVFYHVERSEGFTAQNVQTYTKKCVVFLKTNATQTSSVATGV